MTQPHPVRRIHHVLMVVLVALPEAGSLAQSPSGPTFEVASIKANRTGELGQRIQPSPGGRLTVTNVSLRGLVRFAYELQDVQIDGGRSSSRREPWSRCW